MALALRLFNRFETRAKLDTRFLTGYYLAIYARKTGTSSRFAQQTK